MSLEVNKIAAAVLLAGIIGIGVGKVSSVLYQPEETETRGYTIAGAEDGDEEGGFGDAMAKDAPESILAFLGAADVASGEKTFKTKCATCHTPEQGGAHKQGPNLWSIVGSGKAGKSGFSYSSAMQEKAGSWGFQELSEFLTKPAKYVKGTRMAFAGLKKPQDRADLIAYLNSLGSNKPIPAAPAPAAAAAEPAAEETAAPAAE